MWEQREKCSKELFKRNQNLTLWETLSLFDCKRYTLGNSAYSIAKDAEIKRPLPGNPTLEKQFRLSLNSFVDNWEKSVENSDTPNIKHAPHRSPQPAKQKLQQTWKYPGRCMKESLLLVKWILRHTWVNKVLENVCQQSTTCLDWKRQREDKMKERF